MTGEYDGTSASSPKIATWVYSNANGQVTGADPIGQLTTSTSHDSAENAYVFQQSGFDQFRRVHRRDRHHPRHRRHQHRQRVTGQHLHHQPRLHRNQRAAAARLLPSITERQRGAAPPRRSPTDLRPDLRRLRPALHRRLAADRAAVQRNRRVRAERQLHPWRHVGQQKIGASSSPDNALITSTYDRPTGAATCKVEYQASAAARRLRILESPGRSACDCVVCGGPAVPAETELGIQLVADLGGKPGELHIQPGFPRVAAVASSAPTVLSAPHADFAECLRSRRVLASVIVSGWPGPSAPCLRSRRARISRSAWSSCPRSTRRSAKWARLIRVKG